jgi:menaquinone-dependent protoporphyrinogen oxidase
MGQTVGARARRAFRDYPHGMSAGAADVRCAAGRFTGSMTQSTPAPDGGGDGGALVVYASNHGHTAKIATRLAGAMRGTGLEVDVREVGDAADVQPGRYDLVVVAASVHQEHHQKSIVAWVTSRRDALAGPASAFISVSLSAADDSAESQAGLQGCIDGFLEQTGWTPGRIERIAGALQYREYDFVTRQVMRMLMKRMGHPTDTSHDYDYTDWDGVDRLGRELARSVQAANGVAA